MSVGAVPPPPKYARRAGFYRLSVAQFHQMIQSGVLGEKDRIELLEGYLVPIMPPNPPHSTAVSRSNRTLIRILPDTWHLRSEQPLTLSDSQPQPDFAVVRGDFSAYATRHPGPADVGLVIEVADSSLDEDRDDMGRIFSRSGIPVYWIINVVDRQVEVYTDPRPADPVPAYTTRTDYRAGDSMPLVLDGHLVAQIPVNDLLG
jgi:Uma2 family endonuclease